MGGSSAEDGDEQVSLLLVLETYETLHRRLAPMQLKAQSCEPLLKAISALRSKCEALTEPKNCFASVYNFFFATGLGTLDQLRIELESNYNAKNFRLPVSKGINIDAMIILPIVENETARQKDLRVRSLEHQLEDKEANASRDNSLKHSNAGLRLNDSLMPTETINLVLMCQPNAMPYEVSFYEHWMLRFFLERNTHLVLWNYRGYGRSQGNPSLEVTSHELEHCTRCQETSKVFERQICD